MATKGALAGLPLAFEENRGQFDQQVLFAARHGTGTFFFTAEAMTAAFTRRVEPEDSPPDIPRSLAEKDRPEQPLTENFALKVHFVGASSPASVEGRNPQENKVSYIKGKNPDKWVSGAATFSSIVYHDLWPGIDLEYSGGQDRLKAVYHLARAADISRVRLDYEGQDSLHIDQSGQLVMATPWGNLYEEAPKAEQDDQPVDIAFTIDPATGHVRYRLDGADPDAPLTINP